MTVKHLIFDLYGTLIDSDPRKLAVKRSELMQWGKKRWMCHNKKEGEYFSEYCKTHRGDPRELQESFKEMEASTAFFADVPDLLQSLAEQGYTLHILSNCGRATGQFIKDHNDEFDMFQTINLSYELGYVKPQQEVFEAVLTNIGAEPEECVMIGDSHHNDIEPAKTLGMHAILFDGRHMQVRELQEQIAKLK